MFHTLRNFRFQRIFSWVILFSFACGPGPLDFEEFFTLFEPKTSTRPPAADYYFFTHNYLNFSSENPNSEFLADSLNIKTWYSYSDQKISKNEFREGLYEKNDGIALIQKLRANGKYDAAEYIELAQKIDKETEKFDSYWESAEPLNRQLLTDCRDQAIVKLKACKEDFIKERYVFQIMKIDAKLEDYQTLIDDHLALSETYKEKSYITEWIESRIAGAYLAKGDTAAAVLKFASLFVQSDTRRNQADLSIRRLSSPHFDQALELAKTPDEKTAIYTLQAVQPYQDGLSLMKKIAEINPNHPMLQLIMTREINKNEVSFYSERNSGLYAWSMNVFDNNYNIDSAKIKITKQNAASYFNQLKAFSESLIKNKAASNHDFWYATVAYLDFIDGNYDAMKKNIGKVSKEKPELKKQVDFLQLVYEIETRKSEDAILDQITGFKPVTNFRDNNLLVYLSERLVARYSSEKKETSSVLSSCTKNQKQEKQIGVKAFLAKAISASDNDWNYENGDTKPALLDKADTETLRQVIAFISNPNLSTTEKKLVTLANLNLTLTRLAYARKLVKTQHYETALETFNQLPDSVLNGTTFLTYFSPVPPQHIGSGSVDESLLNPETYFRKVVEYQKQTEKNPKDALAWYNLGLAAYNMSYWGNGWLFSERYRSSAEIEYGNPTSDDYFTNTFAKACFEKALAANPDPELGAKICYAGSLCERNEYYFTYATEMPDTFNEEELDYYRIRMETRIKPGFQKFFSRLKSDYEATHYENEVIKECITYRNYKTL